MSVQHWWNDTDRRKPNYWGKTCPSATVSSPNPTWTNLELKPVFHYAGRRIAARSRIWVFKVAMPHAFRFTHTHTHIIIITAAERHSVWQFFRDGHCKVSGSSSGMDIVECLAVLQGWTLQSVWQFFRVGHCTVSDSSSGLDIAKCLQFLNFACIIWKI